MIEPLFITAAILVAAFGLMYVDRRWIQPWRTQRWVKKILTRVQTGNFVRPAKQSDVGLSIDATGITIRRLRPCAAPLHFIAWSDILRVIAFKRDWGTVDCICIAIAMSSDRTIEVNEEMEGWDDLTDALPKHLPGSKQWSTCFAEIAFPAFATNETVIFERA